MTEPRPTQRSASFDLQTQRIRGAGHELHRMAQRHLHIRFGRGGSRFGATGGKLDEAIAAPLEQAGRKHTAGACPQRPRIREADGAYGAVGDGCEGELAPLSGRDEDRAALELDRGRPLTVQRRDGQHSGPAHLDRAAVENGEPQRVVAAAVQFRWLVEADFEGALTGLAAERQRRAARQRRVAPLVGQNLDQDRLGAGLGRQVACVRQPQHSQRSSLVVVETCQARHPRSQDHIQRHRDDLERLRRVRFKDKVHGARQVAEDPARGGDSASPAACRS